MLVQKNRSNTGDLPTVAKWRKSTQTLVLGALFVGIALISLYAFFWYPMQCQHDGMRHLIIIRRWCMFKVPVTHEGPYYYWLLAGTMLPFRLLSEFDWLTLCKVAIGLGNFFLSVTYIFGAMKLGRVLCLSRRTTVLFAALTVLLPAVRRSFFMARPENLIFALAPWLAAWLMESLQYRLSESRRYWCVVALTAFWGGVCCAQKVSGIAFCACLFAVVAVACWRCSSDQRTLLLLACALIVAAGTLMLPQKALSGKWSWEHHAKDRKAYESHPTAKHFLSFSPLNAWMHPLSSDKQIVARSLWNVGALDMFGDYWRYGFDHYALIEAGQITQVWRTRRARFALGSSALMFAVWFVSLLWLGGKFCHCHEQKEEDCLWRRRTAMSTLTLGGPVFLYAVSLKYFHATKADTYKLEYILMFLPFLFVPVVCMADALSGWKRGLVTALLVLLVLVSVLNSVYIEPMELFR